MIWRLQLKSSRKFFGNVPNKCSRKLAEYQNVSCFFFFVGLVGTSLTGIPQRVSLTKRATLRAASFVHAPLQQIIEMTFYVTSQTKWAESQHETDTRIHTVNSKSINVDMRVFIKIWIPAKAPATKMEWLESRILLTYYHDKIGAWILLEVPEKPQSPHARTQR